MKAAAFDYRRAASVAEALAWLAEAGGDAKIVAGGQSLVPMMAMRLSRPALLIDIHRLTELQALTPAVDHVRTGAGVRQRQIEDTPALDATLPLVRRALRWVGHRQTRNRGTLGGSLVHADPSAELPLAALVLDAGLQLQSQAGGARQLACQDFFLGPMVTAVADTECLLAIDWPVWQGGRVGAAFDETAIRHGDFAMASAACQLQLDGAGRIRRAAIGLGGVGATPLAFPALAQRLVGQTLTPALAEDVAHSAAAESDPGNDMHASAGYRRHLAAVLLARALQVAANDAMNDAAQTGAR
ncbi:MAG: FAD binding domain-containing protein [Rubrivivax sp.]|nr:FAD binding domain-containing protein [Rubrivivax sp.]